MNHDALNHPQQRRPNKFYMVASSKMAQRPSDEFQRELVIPEHSLLRGMIERAIMDIAHTSNHKSSDDAYIRHIKRIYCDAYEWLFAYPDSYKEWSFNWVCEHLSTDPDHLRAAVKALIDGGVKIQFRNKPYLDPMYKAA